MPVKFWQTSVRFCFFLSYLITTVTHNMTTYCSLNHEFSTWKLQVQNMSRTCCVQKLFWMSKQKQFLYTTCTELVSNSMNNLSSYCGLTNSRMSASDTDLPVSFNERLVCCDLFRKSSNLFVFVLGFGGFGGPTKSLLSNRIWRNPRLRLKLPSG